MEYQEIKEGQVIETNMGLALVLHQDEDMPHLWNLLIGKDKACVYDTTKSKARSRVGAMIEHYEKERQDGLNKETRKLEHMNKQITEINKLLDDKIADSDREEQDT
jgi:hypothetical protein